MSGLSTGFSNLYIHYLRQDVAETVKARRLPWLCPTCGNRANHPGPHWTKSGETMCSRQPVWASDLEQPTP